MTPDDIADVQNLSIWLEVNGERAKMLSMLTNCATLARMPRILLIDDDVKGRALKGLLGFQIHVGEPMKVEFKNLKVAELK